MNIVITDGFNLNPGDLSWRDYEQFGDVKYYERSSLEQIVERVTDADIVVTNKTPLSRETINACRHLKLIAVTATGYNVIDVSAAKTKGVVVCNVPEYGTHSVAQHAMALLLAITNRVVENSQTVHAGKWASAVDWCYTTSPLIELKDKVFGVIGMGRIGNQAAKIAEALGMRIVYHRGKSDINSAQQLSCKEVFSIADFVSLHCPLRLDNEKFVNHDLLQLMKPSAYLINTSRGQLIDEDALAEALRSRTIAGAALDVLSKEPPPADHPLFGLKNCIITPHTAWLSKEARSRIMETTLANINSWIQGKPQNVVSN